MALMKSEADFLMVEYAATNEALCKLTMTKLMTIRMSGWNLIAYMIVASDHVC